MTQPKHIEALVQFIIEHLPEGIEARTQRLEALLDILPPDYPRQQEIVKMVLDLKAHQAQQRTFKLSA